MPETSPASNRKNRRALQAADLERLNAMIHRLTAYGARITKQRKQTLLFFLEAPGFVSAMDVYYDLAKIYPGISYDTVYRNIRLFKELGFIEQFVYDDCVKFKMSCIHAQQEHYHLICVRCEKIISMHFEPTQLTAQLPDHFKPMQYRFDVYGHCSSCNE
ncbi:Fur family transcriptional regulator [Paenibacillus hamazuiensis]|uniref:Fur family transcriptional regulator n=1 Tax=Paenibacillus hamazuiensis TaxID=2936508 RepID=UPI00200E05A4|nr:Fur family transcriptional regulator [Paenibacillus hamazuiensis]